MDFFFKKVIGVGSGSLSPNFPYVIDDLVTPADGRSSLWEVHGAHDSSTSVKVKVPSSHLDFA